MSPGGEFYWVRHGDKCASNDNGRCDCQVAKILARGGEVDQVLDTLARDTALRISQMRAEESSGLLHRITTAIREALAAAGQRQQVAALRRLIADDAYAITFQTFGQYRTALLKAIDAGKVSEFPVTSRMAAINAAVAPFASPISDDCAVTHRPTHGGYPQGDRAGAMDHVCGKCETRYLQEQECDWCAGQRARAT